MSINFPLIIDGHLDMAYNALSNGRDYQHSVAWTRAHEADAEQLKDSGLCTVGFPDMLRGRVGLAFGTIFAQPATRRISGGHTYTNAQEAHALGMAQMDWYRRMADTQPHVTLVTDQRALRSVLADWGADTMLPARKPGSPGRAGTAARHRIGIVPLMEGADPILEPRELERWVEMGLRIVGPAWDTTRYSGGTWQKGRLPALGRELLDMMAEFGVVLDVAHMSHESMFEALDVFSGPHVIASHCNPARFVPNVAERHLPDAAIERIAERNGVIGVVLYNRFLKKDWGGRKQEVTLDDVIRMIDHICQVTGSASHVALGSDYDGGLGYNEIPLELNSVRDHHLIGDALLQRGYTLEQASGVMYGNWLRKLQEALPA